MENIPELIPLEAEARRPKPPRPRIKRQYSQPANRSWRKVPLRACRLFTLLLVLPTMFICIPVYMRFRVFSSQMYPMGMTDMRLIDSKISTTWCQGQVVKSNTTFNAFVVPDSPEMSQHLVPVTMTRKLELEDDMKEYWGFYLLQGSTVTVSACVRWPGASLIMIKGYKHLQECAYIGDNSSEELDELLEANKLGLISNSSLLEKLLMRDENPANDPDTMRRHKDGVRFHHPSQDTNDTSPAAVPTFDVTDHDPKELRDLLDKLHSIRQATKLEAQKKYRPPSHLIAVPALHRHRDTNVDRDERRWLSFNDLDGNQQIEDKTKDNNNKFDKYFKTDVKDKDNIINLLALEKAKEDKEKSKNRNNVKKKDIEKTNVTKYETTVTEMYNYSLNHSAEVKPIDLISQIKITTKTIIKQDNYNNEVKESDNSLEVYEEVLKKLQSLGEMGQRVLQKLHTTMKNEPSETKIEEEEELDSDMKELHHLSAILIEAIDEEKKKPERQQRRHDARIKVKRELSLGMKNFEKELNQDDEDRDLAAEEGTDGYAEHHNRLVENNGFDMSNSEFWSSFSSSEEALLECDGLILNLPLTPNMACEAGRPEEDTERAALRNAITYRVPANGYYFFVFNSENEVQTNFISVKFELQKTVYDVTRNALRQCRNSTEKCQLPLDLFTTQKVVLELPLRDNESLWNEQFVVLSECEPRTSVYLVCVIAVPLLIMIFAFQ